MYPWLQFVIFSNLTLQTVCDTVLPLGDRGGGQSDPVTHQLGTEQYHHRACSAETWGGGSFVSLMY